MNILFISKFPPIEGGVSTDAFWSLPEIIRHEHKVHLLSNALEAEHHFREFFTEGDHERLKTLSSSGDAFFHFTDALQRGSYVPWSEPFATKLFGLGLEILDSFSIDIIIGNYFQPYGVVAAQLAKHRNKPYILRHAGSDVGRLMQHRNLFPVYREIVRDARKILTNRNPEIGKALNALGAKDNQLFFIKIPKIDAEYSAPHNDFVLGDFLSGATHHFAKLNFDKPVLDEIESVNQHPFDPDVPILLFYSKASPVKGLFDLVEALKQLASRGLRFRFISVVSGWRLHLEKYFNELFSSPALKERTYILPFVAPWHITSLLSISHIAFVLERDFPIKFHSPRIPREILASPSMLVVSAEIWNKQPYKEHLREGNVTIIDDPKNIAELTNKMTLLLDNPDEVKAIGKRSQKNYRDWENSIGLDDQYPIVRVLDEI